MVFEVAPFFELGVALITAVGPPVLMHGSNMFDDCVFVLELRTTVIAFVFPFAIFTD